MSAKRALIVDDSKSARAFLSRILEKYEVSVDTAESAEQAMDYLGDHRPDVIFMDHLMPGMDGFQALQSIKNNPRTAMIPIMMYTSQEGELYLGQARALGAIGVLPKQIKPADVSRVLYQLRILPDRRGGDAFGAFTPANASAQSAAAARLTARETTEPPQLRVVSNSATAPSSTDLRALVESVVERHMGDLHRAVNAGLDAQSERLLGDVRVAVQDAIAEAPSLTDPDAAFMAPAHKSGVASRWPWSLAALAAIAAALAGAMWWRESVGNRDLAAELLAARQQSVALTEKLNLALRSERDTVDQRLTADTASADGLDRRLPVPFGEIALAGERLDVLRALLAKLQADKFQGLVTVTSFAGRFCLRKGADGFEPAAEATPATRCDLLGNPFDESLSSTQREPLALANLAGSIRQQSGGAMRVQLAAGSNDVLAMPYPATTDQLTAGDWNRAAVANNRVEIRVLADAQADPGT